MENFTRFGPRGTRDAGEISSAGEFHAPGTTQSGAQSSRFGGVPAAGGHHDRAEKLGLTFERAGCIWSEGIIARCRTW